MQTSRCSVWKWTNQWVLGFSGRCTFLLGDARHEHFLLLVAQLFCKSVLANLFGARIGIGCRSALRPGRWASERHGDGGQDRVAPNHFSRHAAYCAKIKFRAIDV